MHRLWTGSLHLDRLTLPIVNLPQHLDGMKVVQMSDFHYDVKKYDVKKYDAGKYAGKYSGGIMLPDELLWQAIVATNQANPDLIFLTGDFINYKPDPIYRLAEQLKALRSRYGIFAVLGNHDLIGRTSRAEITDALTKAEIQVLWNQVVYPCGDQLAIVGLPDFWAKDFRPSSVFAPIPATVPRLVLSHNPDSAAVLQQWRVDVQFSGHTHGGQIVLPGIGNLSAIVAEQYEYLPIWVKKAFPVLRATQRVVKNWQWVSGLHKVGNNRLYVNRGLGSYPPGRLFCPPEVTIMTLVTA
jgi:hypothetical protein